MKRAIISTALAGLALLGLAGCDSKGLPPEAAAPKPAITVFAAASTTDVLRAIAAKFEAATGTKVLCSFDSSSTLAKQIKAGAPADVYISADETWMDELAASHAIHTDSRADLLGNELVLIAPRAKPFEAKMSRDFEFVAKLPGIQRIAVGDPAHVPAGVYARESLDKLGWLEELQPKLIAAPDVRAALRLVEMGEAEAGIVYSTDAKSSEKVIVVGVFPSASHEPIRYPVAVCTAAKDAAGQFVKFLRSPEARTIFEAAGFTVLTASEH